METTEQKIERLEQKVDKIYISVEKTRRYFFWTGVITLAIIILPLIGLLFVLPAFMSNYVGSIEGLLQ
jgi:hypothetical protein